MNAIARHLICARFSIFGQGGNLYMKQRVILFLLAVGIIAPQKASAILLGSLQQVAPLPATYVSGIDFFTFTDNGFAQIGGPITASVTSIDIVGSTSGCEAADFAGAPAGRFFLMKESSSCTTTVQLLNATAAGATGALIVDDTGIVNNLTFSQDTSIPSLFISSILGQNFQGLVPSGLTLTLQVSQGPVTQPVPEPTSLLLFGVGIFALKLARRMGDTEA